MDFESESTGGINTFIIHNKRIKLTDRQTDRQTDILIYRQCIYTDTSKQRTLYTDRQIERRVDTLKDRKTY